MWNDGAGALVLMGNNTRHSHNSRLLDEMQCSLSLLLVSDDGDDARWSAM